MKNLILISQIQRSGGTLLSQLFDGHPECSVYPGECMLLKGGWPKIKQLYYRRKIFDQDDWHFKSYVKNGYEKSTEEFISFEFDFEKRNKMFSPGWFPREDRILSSFFRSIFYGWKNYKGNRDGAVVAFSPSLIGNLASVSEDKKKRVIRDNYFKRGGKIITVIRDPGSWYLSARTHSATYGTNCLAKHYIPSVQGALSLSGKFPEQCLPILFSDLTSNTEKVMRVLAAQLGIEYDERLLIPTFNCEEISSNSSFEKTKGMVSPKQEERYKSDDIDWELSWRLYDKCKKMFALG